MVKIENKGNLPLPIQTFLGTLQDSNMPAGEVWECYSTDEIEKLGIEKKCELTCVMDPKTKRGYLVGFNVEETNGGLILVGVNPMKMLIYFKELTDHDFNRYARMLNKHRNEQEDDMLARRERAAAAKRIKSPEVPK